MIKKICILFLFLLATFLVLNNPISAKANEIKLQQLTENTNPEYVTDAEYDYFGKWNGKTWTIEGQLNYALPQLNEIEFFVKKGDYINAKEALLKYYKNKESLKGMDIGYASSADIDVADLMCRDIVVATNSYTYIKSVEVPTDDKWNVFDVSGYLSLGQSETFTFIAGGKKDNVVSFDSKEGTNKCYLELQLNGQKEVIYPSMDTYIRAGEYETVNYGVEPVLEVNDTGFPYDDNTRRTTMIFDLNGYKGTITGGKIYLYGSSEKDTCEVMVFNTNNTAWNERELTWKTETSGIFSWETSPEGTDWRSPKSGAMNQFQETIGGLGLINTVLTAHHKTQNAKYAVKAHDLILDFIKDCKDNFNFPDSLRLGQRQRGLPGMVNYLLKTDVFTADSFFKVMYFLYLQNDFLGNPLLEYPKYTDVHGNASFVTTSNWGVIQNNGFFIGTYFMSELKKFSTWAELTQNRIVQLVDLLIKDDGSYDEDNTSYPIATLGSYTNAIKFAAANGIELNSRVKQKMREWATWIMDFSFPNGYCPSYGDSGYVVSKDSVLGIGRILNDPELIYFGTLGSSGTVPEHTSAIYPDNITGILRNGWSRNSIFMHINTFNGTHSHTDVNGIILYAYGQALIPDSGTKSYDKADPISNWQLTSNEAHSTLRIDSSDPTRGGVYKNELKLWQSNELFDVYSGYTEMYDDAPHTRTVVMVKPGFYIVSDFVENKLDKERQYELNWHFMPHANPTINDVTKKVTTNNTSGANIQIIVDDYNASASIFEGYITALGGVTQNNDNAKYVLSSSNNFMMNTILYPTFEGQEKNVSSIRVTTDLKDASAMRIDFDSTNSNNKAYYGIANKYSNQSYNITDGTTSYSTNSSIFYHEFNTNGDTQRIIISKGSKLNNNGRALIESPVVLTQFGLEKDGTTINLSGDIVPCLDKTKCIKIYAPSITGVTINGEACEFIKEGDYIYCATSSAVSEKEYLEGLIDNIPSLDNLTKDEGTNLIAIKNKIRLYSLKGMDINNIDNYGYIAEAEFRVNTLSSLSEFQVRMNFLPELDELELSHVEQVKSLRNMLEQLIEDTGDDPLVFKKYSDLLAEYEAVTSTFYDRVGMHLISDSVDDYTINYNGKDYWWYYYQVSKTGQYGNFGETVESTPIPGACWGSTVDGATVNNPRNASDYQVPQTDAYPVKVWKAPCNGTVKVKFTVGAYYNMLGGNGVTCVGVIGEMPFVVSEDGTTLERNPNAFFIQQVDALDPNDPQIVYYTFETVVYLEEGEIISLGSDANGLSAHDHVYVAMNVEFLTNIKTTTLEVFNKYSDLISRLDKLPEAHEITLDDRTEVEQLVKEINEFGREKIDNISKLDAICAKLDELVNVGYNIQTFVNGEGTITVSKEVGREGEIISITLNPQQGYVYSDGSLEVNGEKIDSLNFIMPASFTSITCTFEKIQYTITNDKYDNSIVKFSSERAAFGEKVYFSIIPKYGYAVDYDTVKINGEKIDDDFFIMPMGEAHLSYSLKEVSNNKKGCKSSSESILLISIALAVITFVMIIKKTNLKKPKASMLSLIFILMFAVSLSSCKNKGYNIEYDANGGRLAQESRFIDSVDNFYLDVPSNENASFIGWFDGLDEDSKQITDKSGHVINGYVLEEDLVVFAKWNYWETSGLMYELNSTKDGYCLIGAPSNLTSIIVPELYLGLPIVRVNSYAFYENKNLREITLPSTVTTIGAHAFHDCEKLEKIVLSDETTLIEKSAFEGCGNLLFVNVPKKLSEVSEYAFKGCSSLYEMDFSLIEGELEILEEAFAGCSVLTSVKLNNTIKKIDLSTFSGCAGLQSFDTGSSVEIIEESAFANSGLRSINIGKNVYSLGANFLKGCSNLSTITVDSENDNYISENNILYTKERNTLVRYAPMKEEKECTIDSNVTLILSSAFDSTKYVESLTILDNVEEIEFNAFGNMQELSSIRVPFIGGTKNYNNYFAFIFGGEQKTTNTNIPYTLTDVVIDDGITTIPAYAFQFCANIKNMEIPSTVTNIGESAFYGCSNLTSIVLPEKIDFIGEMAFYACMRIGSFQIDDENEYFKTIDGVLYSKNLEELIQYPAQKEATTYTINSSTKIIKAGAFYNTKKLEEIVVPSSVITIGDYAFGLCSNLKTINLDGTNIESLGVQCFSSCKGIKEIVLPETLNQIGSQAFENCSGLEKIIIKYDNVPKISKMSLINTPEDMKIVFLTEELLNKYSLNTNWKEYKDLFELNN